MRCRGKEKNHKYCYYQLPPVLSSRMHNAQVIYVPQRYIIVKMKFSLSRENVRDENCWIVCSLKREVAELLRKENLSLIYKFNGHRAVDLNSNIVDMMHLRVCNIVTGNSLRCDSVLSLLPAVSTHFVYRKFQITHNAYRRVRTQCELLKLYYVVFAALQNGSFDGVIKTLKFLKCINLNWVGLDKNFYGILKTIFLLIICSRSACGWIFVPFEIETLTICCCCALWHESSTSSCVMLCLARAGDMKLFLDNFWVNIFWWFLCVNYVSVN